MDQVSTEIVLREYDPTWPEQFRQVRDHLFGVLGSLALRIDHIGSTSVPGMAAKDILDLQVSVNEWNGPSAERLAAAGYRRTDLTRDHVPAGEDPQPSSWRKLLFTDPPGQRRCHVHVRVAGQTNQLYPLLFRDYLRHHPETAALLDLAKRRIARYHSDIASYYDIKDPVYDLVWDAARRGARATAWSPG